MENKLTTCTRVPIHPRYRRPMNVPPCGEPATHRLTGQGETHAFCAGHVQVYLDRLGDDPRFTWEEIG